MDGPILLGYVSVDSSNDLFMINRYDSFDYPPNNFNWSEPWPVEGQSSKTAPSLAVPFRGLAYRFGNPLCLAYVANNDSNDLLTDVSTDRGENWTGSRLVEGQSSKTAPALTFWRKPDDSGWRLLLAYVANNDTNDLLTAESTDYGKTWTGSRLVGGGESSKCAPALTWWLPDGQPESAQLVLAYVASNDSNDLLTASSTDGINWTGSRLVEGQSSKSAPALTTFQRAYGGGVPEELVIAYVANNDRNDLLTTSSTDGIKWTGSRLVEGQSSKAGPALLRAQSGGQPVLVMSYVADNASDELLIAESTDGILWTGGVRIWHNAEHPTSRIVHHDPIRSKTTPSLLFALGYE
jgi:hypothetical protein